MTKAERATSLLAKAAELGSVPTIEGNWVVFRPVLPVSLILEASELGDHLADALRKAETGAIR